MLWPWPLPRQLDLWSLTLNICSVSLVTWWNLPNLTAIEQPQQSYCAFNIRPNDLERNLTCYARISENFHQVWPSTTYPRLNYVMSHCDLDLWPVDLASLWYIKRHVIKARTKFERNRAIRSWIINDFAIFAHAMSRYNLDLWPLDLELLQHFGCRVFKLCTEFERNQIIHGWINDYLARFRRAILWGGTQLPELSQGCVDPTSPNLARTYRAIIEVFHFCFRVRISSCIFIRGRLRFEWSFKRRQISHFLSPTLYET